MKRLLEIEYIKQRHFKAFWILLVLHFVLLALLLFSFHPFLEFLDTKDFGLAAMIGVKPSDLPFFDFLDIWQNLTWIAGSFKFILAFIVVMSVCNEYSYKTVRQNIIDGLSKREFVYSKFLLVVILSAASSIFIWCCGMILGFLYSPITGVEAIFANVAFVFAYFLELVVTLSFAMLFGFLLKRSGLSIMLFVIYLFTEFILWFNVDLGENLAWLQRLAPGDAISNTIRWPFSKYFLRPVQDYVGVADTFIAIAYIGVFVFLSYTLLKKRDL